MLWALFALSTLLAACEREAPRPKTALPLPPEQRRIVSLGPFVTELVFALGAEKQLVGVTDCCDYPPEAKKIACIGTFNAPSIEKILSLKPTVVIGSSMETPEFVAAMKAAGVPFVRTYQNSFTEIFESVRTVGEAAGRVGEADALAARLQSEVAVIAGSYRRNPGETGPRVFIEVWHDPLTTAGGTSFLHDVVAKAGGFNVAGEIAQMYPIVNPEKVVEWNPEVVVLCYMTPAGQAAMQLANRIGWSKVAAVRQGRIITDIPPDLLLRPGPRLLLGLRLLADRLNTRPAPALLPRTTGETGVPLPPAEDGPT